MRLRSLAIRNYRSIRHLQVEFPEGLLGIVGHNGAGKSSLLEAVAWALYGTPAVRTRAEAVATIGASDACRVRLEFDLGGEAFRLERVLKPSTTTAELARGDATAPPSGIDIGQVLEHALRHVAWLRQDDPVIAELLGDWSDALADYVPEPFRALGGPPI